MVLAIMQPYFLPYIGYWQLLNAVDSFVVYDDIEYTKKGWITRNRFLLNGKDVKFTLPIKKNSDNLFICDRIIADSFSKEKNRILRRIESAYRKAPFFDEIFPIVKTCFNYEELNLFRFIYHSITVIKDYLKINTKLYISSQLNDFTDIKGQDKVIAICSFLGARKYVNPIGGIEIYSSEAFLKEGVELRFLKSKNIQYNQLGNDFVPWLSIIDILMFNDYQTMQNLLNEYVEV